MTESKVRRYLGKSNIRRTLLAMGIVLMSSVSWAAPFLVCDPQTGVDYYTVDTDGVVVTGIV